MRPNFLQVKAAVFFLNRVDEDFAMYEKESMLVGEEKRALRRAFLVERDAFLHASLSKQEIPEALNRLYRRSESSSTTSTKISTTDEEQEFGEF